MFLQLRPSPLDVSDYFRGKGDFQRATRDWREFFPPEYRFLFSFYWLMELLHLSFWGEFVLFSGVVWPFFFSFFFRCVKWELQLVAINGNSVMDFFFFFFFGFCFIFEHRYRSLVSSKSCNVCFVFTGGCSFFFFLSFLFIYRSRLVSSSWINYSHPKQISRDTRAHGIISGEPQERTRVELLRLNCHLHAARFAIAINSEYIERRRDLIARSLPTVKGCPIIAARKKARQSCKLRDQPDKTASIRLRLFVYSPSRSLFRFPATLMESVRFNFWRKQASTCLIISAETLVSKLKQIPSLVPILQRWYVICIVQRKVEQSSVQKNVNARSTIDWKFEEDDEEENSPKDFSIAMKSGRPKKSSSL